MPHSARLRGSVGLTVGHADCGRTCPRKGIGAAQGVGQPVAPGHAPDQIRRVGAGYPGRSDEQRAGPTPANPAGTPQPGRPGSRPDRATGTPVPVPGVWPGPAGEQGKLAGRRYPQSAHRFTSPEVVGAIRDEVNLFAPSQPCRGKPRHSPHRRRPLSAPSRQRSPPCQPDRRRPAPPLSRIIQHTLVQQIADPQALLGQLADVVGPHPHARRAASNCATARSRCPRARPSPHAPHAAAPARRAITGPPGPARPAPLPAPAGGATRPHPAPSVGRPPRQTPAHRSRSPESSPASRPATRSPAAARH